MKKIVFLFIVVSQSIFAQETFSVDKLASRIRFSGESVQMDNEANIGFLGHGFEVFGLSSKFPDWYFGVTSYAAITGIRSGFIVFGVSTGVQKKLFTDWLSYDVGLFLGGGGGSGAPDGGGFMVRPHLEVQVDVSKKMALRAGVSAVEFPSGEIGSVNFTLGAVINTDIYLVNQAVTKIQKSEDASFFKGIDVSLLSSNLFNFSKGPLKHNVNVNKNAPTISLLGVALKSRNQHNNFYGVLKLGGAFIGEVDGFMMLLTGIGYEYPITHWLSLEAKGLIGGAGGGNVDFGGGLAAQLEVGLGINYSNYLANINLGNTYAPNGNFKSNHVDFSIGKKFEIYSNSTIEKSELVHADNLKKEDFTFSVFNRSYLSKDRPDKLKRPYDQIFNLLGFELEKKLNDRIGLLGATVWAYQGNYGAYAEGWLGLQYYQPVTEKLQITAKGMLGAAGGGDINLGSGMAMQYSLGLHREINNRWSLIVNVGQVRPVLDGNFTPFLVDLGLKLNLSQLVKK